MTALSSAGPGLPMDLRTPSRPQAPRTVPEVHSGGQAASLESLQPGQDAQLRVIKTYRCGDLAMLVKELPSFLEVEYS